MSTLRPISNRYRQILIASFLSSTSLLALNPALADQNTAAGGSTISNQATAEFTDAGDTAITPTQIKIVSDVVSVTVAEIAGITIGSTPTTTGVARRGGKITVDFKVYNSGNDPTKIFIPGAPSVATYNNGTAFPPGSIEQLEVIKYTTVKADGSDDTFADIPSGTGRTVGSGGSSTSALTGLTAVAPGGSIPAGAYITVRVTINIPQAAINGQNINITLGNTGGGADANNVSYSAATPATDLYTIDNNPANYGDVNGAPTNGEREASKAHVVTIATPTVNVSGRVWDDANGSGLDDFTKITDTGTVGLLDPGANPVGTPVLNAVLVGSDGNVIAKAPVTTGGTTTTNGTYTFTNVVGYQTGVYVILTTAPATVGSTAPAALTLPAGWVNTTPLTYAGTNAFNLTNLDVTDKDFGIELLPIALGGTATAVVNPTGTTSVSVAPTLFTTSSTDAEDGKPTSYLITGFPTFATSITIGSTTYTAATFATAFPTGATVSAANLSTISVDPVDGGVTVAIPFKAIDKAGKVSTLGSTANVEFTAANISISGTVWNDKDKSGVSGGPIFTTGETGTNAVNGTSTIAVKAVLIDVTGTATLIGTATVNSTDGTYTFLDVPPSKKYQVLLVPETTTVTASTVASLPLDWVKTAEITTANFSVALVPVGGKDFGIRQKPKVVLVKRITKINDLDTGLNTYNNNTGTDDDNTMNWPLSTTGYLLGAVNGGTVKPGDKIEYTIYFLNNQGSDAGKVKICDAILGAQTYNAGSMKLSLNGLAPIDLTDAVDASDRASTYTATEAATLTGCNLTGGSTLIGDKTTVPGVKIDITGTTGSTQLPLASLAATKYGYFRFTTTVKP